MLNGFYLLNQIYTEYTCEKTRTSDRYSDFLNFEPTLVIMHCLLSAESKRGLWIPIRSKIESIFMQLRNKLLNKVGIVVGGWWRMSKRGRGGVVTHIFYRNEAHDVT